MRRIWSGHRGPLIVLLAGCLFGPWLAGCSGDDPPPADATHHPGTALPSTTTTPPDRVTAAIAAVQRMYAAFNQALTSGETADFRKTFANSCAYCVSNARLIESTTNSGQKIVGGRYHLIDARLAAEESTFVMVQGHVAQGRASIVKRGKVLKTYSAAPARLVVWRVELVNASWIVTQEQVPQ